MEEIFKISKDRERAQDLFEMAKERLELLKLIPKDKPYKIIEEYYEIIKELLTAIMFAQSVLSNHIYRMVLIYGYMKRRLSVNCS